MTIIHSIHHSFADSLSVPTFNLGWYFLRTDSLWYYSSWLVAIYQSKVLLNAWSMKTATCRHTAATATTSRRLCHLMPPDHQTRAVVYCGTVICLCSRTIVRASLTFQNCLLASLPPTLFRILAPPGCSSTKPPISYTSLSMIMCRPFSRLPASFTSLTVNSFDMVGGFGRGLRLDLGEFGLYVDARRGSCIDLVFRWCICTDSVCDWRCLFQYCRG
jgi:hypothetical protein